MRLRQGAISLSCCTEQESMLTCEVMPPVIANVAAFAACQHHQACDFAVGQIVVYCAVSRKLAWEEDVHLRDTDAVHRAAQIAAATQGCPANLQALHDLHGFQRMTQFLQWAALTFPSRCCLPSCSLQS